MLAKAQKDESKRLKEQKETTLKELEQAKRDVTLFHKMKIRATQSLKQWAIDITKEAIELIPATID